MGITGYKLFDHLKLLKKESETQGDVEMITTSPSDKIEGNAS